VTDGFPDGRFEGLDVGNTGELEGLIVGFSDGFIVGMFEGLKDGEVDRRVGAMLGKFDDGAYVGVAPTILQFVLFIPRT